MNRLERFLWSPVPATPIALLRMAVGAVAAIWAATLLPIVDPWLAAPGIGGRPSDLLGRWTVLPSLSPAGFMVVVLLTFLAGVATAIGWKTRVASWTLFLLLLALQRQNPGLVNGGDLILRLLSLGVALSPAGDYLSLDARARGWSWRAPLVTPIALRFVQLHISLGYLLSAALKLRGATWREGTALWYALQIGDLTRLQFDPMLLLSTPSRLVTWGTIGLELALGLGIWNGRTRPWVLVAGIGLHVGIAVAYEIGFFPWVMMASYLAFLKPVGDVREVPGLRWLRRSRPGPEALLTVNPEGSR